MALGAFAPTAFDNVGFWTGNAVVVQPPPLAVASGGGAGGVAVYDNNFSRFPTSPRKPEPKRPDFSRLILEIEGQRQELLALADDDEDIAALLTMAII